jgi:transcriptional regulator with XRE-family HTH domain
MVGGPPMSSISKPHLDHESAWRLGQEIRRRRTALGLSQSDLGRPLTRAFVSAVENGQCVPSLSTLVLMAERLNITSGELLASVNPHLAPVYTAKHAAGQNASS